MAGKKKTAAKRAATSGKPIAIKMTATSAGPKGNLAGGHTYAIGSQVDVDEAKELVEGHYAEYVYDGPAPDDEEASEEKGLETADETGGTETAAER